MKSINDVLHSVFVSCDEDKKSFKQPTAGSI